MIPARVMAKAKPKPRKPRVISSADKLFVKEITGAIINRAEKELRLTREDLAAKAGKKSASTLYGWRNGWRQNPSLLDVQAYAIAVGWTLGLSDGSDSQVGSCRRQHVGTDYERHLLALVRAISQGPSDKDRSDLLALVSNFVLERTSGTRPLGPAEQTE